MFEQVTIIGTGLLGGSLARDLRHLGLAKKIIGVCRSKQTAQLALAEQVVDEVLPIREAVKNSSLIVLATPMKAMLPLLQEVQGSISENCVLTDVGSVKSQLYKEVQQQCPSLLGQFVFAHPIAGGEHSGVSASKTGLFNNKHVIITKTDEVHDSFVSTVKEMWGAVGADVVPMSLEQHDQIFAKTSHLPHVIAFSMVNFLDHQADRDLLFDMAAAGFYDFTRIASSDATMWRDICLTNGDQIVAALDAFQSNLTELRNAIDSGDGDDILTRFKKSKEARDSGLEKKALKKIFQNDAL